MNLEKHGMLRRDALSELVNLLRIRYTLSERVYFHHTKISSGAMISKAVELALREGLRAEELRTLEGRNADLDSPRAVFDGIPIVAHLLELSGIAAALQGVLRADRGYRRGEARRKSWTVFITMLRNAKRPSARLRSRSGIEPHRDHYLLSVVRDVAARSRGSGADGRWRVHAAVRTATTKKSVY